MSATEGRVCIGSAPSCEAQDFRNDPVERQHAIGKARIHDSAGHAPDDAGRFILRYDGGAASFENFNTTQAVLSHPGEDYRDDCASVDLAYGGEQSVHGRAARVLLRCLIE